MTILGMPEAMFAVFVATILAGSLGAFHYVIVHVLLGKPFRDEAETAVTSGDGPEAIAERGGEVDD
ncbi:hypothetical protein [Natronorubrum halophilum]|uniref:hypothetical protein n=1 Tax=Natronorubrum halophilum TaxID=1702106 RepID=UPI000EF68064|nr:hypothetical protein [Natronorubrum halophilum]